MPKKQTLPENREEEGSLVNVDGLGVAWDGGRGRTKKEA